jgi:hypothetical protein
MRSVEIQAILEIERKAVKEWFNVLWARREAELVSRLSHNTSTAAASQVTLALLTGDALRQLVRSSVGSALGIISYCLLYNFVCFYHS